MGNLFTIRAEYPFLETLTGALLSNQLGLSLDARDPVALARLTIFLPTRRAARALSQMLVAGSLHKALILPRIIPLGDPGEAELQDILIRPETAELPLEPIEPMRRQLLLALQIRHAAAAYARDLASFGSDAQASTSFAASTLGAAYRLAGDLAAILDDMQSEDVPYDRLTTLDATRFDQHWQLTGQLLAILGEFWPQHLAECGLADPIAWRNTMLDRQSALIARSREPVLVAGSTGSMPATARLIATVAGHARGAVVLPDLAVDADAGLWEALATAAPERRDRAAAHPQAQLALLMQHIGYKASDVVAIGYRERSPAMRRKLAGEALRLAETTDAWETIGARLSQSNLDEALEGVMIAEPADDRTEAITCAIAIRKALAESKGTVAVITPDRNLATRIRLELARWNIAVGDGAGQALARTSGGHLVRLVCDTAMHGVTAQRVLALLRHPAARIGRALDELARAAAALEIGAFRGARLGQGLQGLIAAADAIPERRADHHAPGPLRRLTDADVDLARRVIAELAGLLQPWLDQSVDNTLGDRARALRTLLTELTGDPESGVLAFSGEDGAAVEQLIDDLGRSEVPASADDFALVVADELASRVVRSRMIDHPRVAILGLLEARLMSPDFAILAGLNEGTWPQKVVTDAFLNRAMRAELGLSSPERRIGQSAHDFTQALCCPRVLLVRAAKSDGVQTIPSRFWQRLKAITPAQAWERSLAQGNELVALARLLDQPQAQVRIGRPAPRVPAHRQPIRFSVSDAETLFRDPYALYARNVLDLRPLEPIDVVLGAADRGSLLHEVMERLARDFIDALPPDLDSCVRAIGEEVFAPLLGEPDVAAFWWPRFLQMIPGIVAFERQRRAACRRVGAEMRTAHDFSLPDGACVRLTARADRVELTTDGGLAILDFKTGTIPTARQIASGLAPQLPLEAALARRAGFRAADGGEDFPPVQVAAADYIALKPGAAALEIIPVSKPGEIASLAETHLDGFLKMVAEFRAGHRTFVSRFAPEFMRHAGDYDHLARVKEWTVLCDDSAESDG